MKFARVLPLLAVVACAQPPPPPVEEEDPEPHEMEVVDPPAIASFVATPDSVAAGGTVTLTATFTNGSGTVDGGIGTIINGVAITTPALSTATTYTLTVTNPVGVTVTATTTVAVIAPTITSFTSAKTLVTTGHATTITPVFSGGSGSIDHGIG